MEVFWTAYFSTVGIAGIYIILRIRKFIDHLETYRKKSLQKVQEFSPVRTDFPGSIGNKSVRAAGIESIETRFSMIRRILAPFILFFWSCLLFIPLFPAIPGVFASIIAAFITGLIAITTRPIFENAVAGMVVSFSQPVRIGDTVKIDGHYGTIEEITITHTKMKVWDWQRYIIPNRSLLEKEFINYSIVDESIWAYVEFWVSYDVDLEILETLSLEAAKKSRYLLDCEEPAFWVMGLQENSICCWLAGWAASPGDAWELKTSIRKELIKSFQKNNIHTHLQNIHIQQPFQDTHKVPQQQFVFRACYNRIQDFLGDDNMISKVKIFSVVVLAFLCTLFALFSFGYYKAKRDIQRKLPNVKQLQYHDISAFSTKVYGGGCDVWFEYSYISFAFKVQNADDPEFVCEWILSKKGPKIIYGGWMEDVD